jgi:hypothetical protein
MKRPPATAHWLRCRPNSRCLTGLIVSTNPLWKRSALLPCFPNQPLAFVTDRSVSIDNGPGGYLRSRDAHTFLVLLLDAMNFSPADLVQPPLGHILGPGHAPVGRGGRTNHDEYAIEMRNLVDEFRFEYLFATNLTEKRQIVRYSKGVFQLLDRHYVGLWNGEWYKLNDQAVYRKIVQRLRERAPEYLMGLIQEHLPAEVMRPAPGKRQRAKSLMSILRDHLDAQIIAQLRNPVTLQDDWCHVVDGDFDLFADFDADTFFDL